MRTREGLVDFHAIGHDHAMGAADLERRVGRLGADLDVLARELALTTPPGFVVDSEYAAMLTEQGWSEATERSLESSIHLLESETGRQLGDPSSPLFLAVRGVTRTILWAGLSPANLGATAEIVGSPRAAAAELCTYLEEFAAIVLGADMSPFTANVEAARVLSGGDDHPLELLQVLGQRHHDLLGTRFPDSAIGQVQAAIASLASEGPVVVQEMVHGTADGVASSRNLTNGDAGVLAPHGFEAVTDELASTLRQVELHLRDAVELNVVLVDESIVVLGGGIAARSGVAAVRIAHSLTTDPEVALSRSEAVGRVDEHHVEQLLHHSFDTGLDLEVIASGLGASPGAAVGLAVFSADDAVELADAGEAVILVAQETSPEDVHGMEVAAGILTSRGGLASHAAVVARGWGIPAVCGAEQVMIGDDMFMVGDHVVSRGDLVSLDGATGEVMLGAAQTSSAEPPEEFDHILEWADEIRRGHLMVRANADSGPDAAQARAFGAEGIGLCRTEHMFLAADRLPIVRDMILASSPARERAALTRLRLAQRDDFVEILEAMDGLPVTIRLLDPPLHEFLPDLEELVVAEAKGELDDNGVRLLEAARKWSEQNPMIGTRGVRLGWLKPGLYAMQVRALVEAATERLAAGGDPIIEIMIPLTVSAPELAGARGWVEDALSFGNVDAWRITIGTMIETPRAALVAHELAEHADFFSFGTNDLTQLTYGFSRDDVETRIMGMYVEKGLLPHNPFEHLDGQAVVELVRIGTERGRATKSDLKIGICGEHGGDPTSIAACVEIGLDYVSCSPYRVPVARLAAAQAVIARSR